MYTNYLNIETEMYGAKLIKEYYINDFCVSRPEFLYYFGDISAFDIERLKKGDEITKNNMTFKITNWDCL